MRACFPFYSARVDKLELFDLFEKRNEKLLLKFWEFLRLEFAHETLSFYMSIQEFKNLCPKVNIFRNWHFLIIFKDHQAIRQRALLIYEKYLKTTSPKEVNIEMTIRFRLREEIRRLLTLTTIEDSEEIRELQQSIFQDSETDAIIQLKQGCFYRFKDVNILFFLSFFFKYF